MNYGNPSTPELIDLKPPSAQVLAEVLKGLLRSQKTLSSKYFYDERGSILFEQICELDEYYLTRTELALMRDQVWEMGKTIGPDVLIIEYGAGNLTKIRLLLDHLKNPKGFIPVDISREHLADAANSLVKDYPGLPVLPVCADFTAPFELPAGADKSARKVGYFPGSTIGNLTRGEIVSFLRGVAETCGEDGGLLIGVDLVKNVKVLETAYNDSRGITGEFNLNILNHINNQLGTEFRLDRFEHRAHFNARESRIEMHLVCTETHAIQIGSKVVRFEAGETIHTENSHKFTLEGFSILANKGGFEVKKVWTDDKNWFSLQYLEVNSR